MAKTSSSPTTWAAVYTKADASADRGADRLGQFIAQGEPQVTPLAVIGGRVCRPRAASSLADAQPYFARHRYAAFPVTDSGGRAVGLAPNGSETTAVTAGPEPADPRPPVPAGSP